MRLRVVPRLAAVVVGGLAALVLAAWWVNARGARFFETGRDVERLLDRIAAAARDGQASALEAATDVDFEGTDVGLSTRTAAQLGVGVTRERFQPGGRIDRLAWVEGWRRYRRGFTSLDELALRLVHIEEWSRSAVVATIGFEARGVPVGATHAIVDRAQVRASFTRRGDEVVLTSASLVSGERLGGGPQFVDVAHEAGVDFLNRYYQPFLSVPLRFGMIRFGPAGISAVDYDNDGWDDLFVPDGVESRLFRNLGDGRFEDVTARAGLDGLSGVSVAVFADYDNDGHRDLFVSRTFAPNQLFHANGNGTFTDVTTTAGLGTDCCTAAASWGDYDNDGRLDLYVARYLDPRSTIPTTLYARNGEPNQLYHNNGDGTFTNVTSRAGVGDTGLALGCAWGDYDDDGYPDLYVANDFGRNVLYHNERNGTFLDVTAGTGTLDYGAGMSASFGDYDNDGHLDLYVANIRTDHAWLAEAPTVLRYLVTMARQGTWTTDLPLYWEIFRQSGWHFVGVFQQMASGNTLLHNQGRGTFEDATTRAGTNPPGWFWGSGFADFDNDGWLDVYSANGWVYGAPGADLELSFLDNVFTRQRDYKSGMFFDPRSFGGSSWHGWERNRLLHNNGDGTFTETGTPAGADLLLNSRGVALADFWNRGAIDIAVAASADRHALLKNSAPGPGHWLEVSLTGTRSNRDAVGARVSIRVGAARQLREVAAGDGYASQNSLRLHFGLGSATIVDELVVSWPVSGATQRFRRISADRCLRITEGSGGAPRN